jgi:dihydrofolate reductase
VRRIVIAAVARNRVIGRANGEMPWRVPEDFKHFKKTTMGSPLVMGRKTFESLGGPLPGRPHYVASRREGYAIPHEAATVVGSLEEGLRLAEESGAERAFISGGGSIYRRALERDLADEMILSWMKFDAEGEITFPEFDERAWRTERRDDRDEFEIVYYTKRRASD